MLENISSNSMMSQSLSQSSTKNTNNGLTDSQLETISSVLENYDASSLTQSDAQSIVEAFKDAGIKPSSELESAMSEAGFDAKEVGSLAGKGSGSMPPPPPSEEEFTSISSLLDTLLGSDDEDSSSFTSDSILDYTSRILSLNESSKDEVMNLLDKYSGDDLDYSSDDINSLLKSSLTQILGDTSNYKSVSFYG